MWPLVISKVRFVTVDRHIRNISRVLCFRTPTMFAPRLKEAGFDYLGMANNHAHDFGNEGILSTMACLDRIGIKHSGIRGIGPECAIVSRGGRTYGFCSFGHNEYTLRHQDLETVRRIITYLVNRCDYVVVGFMVEQKGLKLLVFRKGARYFVEKIEARSEALLISVSMQVQM